MHRLSHQPRIMVLAIAASLGLVALGAGCSSGQNNNGTMPATPATAPAMPPQNTPPPAAQPPAMAPATPTTTNANNDADASAGMGNSNQPVTDTWITTKVEAKLHTIDGLDNGDVSVETNNGVVSLSGHVKSQTMRDTVVNATKTIKGVKNVDTSRLKVGS